MTANLLLLHPEDPAECPDPDALVAVLTETGLIGDSFEFEGRAHWRPGDRFLDHVTFLGCSPVIAMDGPGANGDYCHIGIDGPHRAPSFVAGANVKAPRCPSCKYRLEGWEAVVAAWQQAPDTYLWRCPMCGQEYSAPRLQWRRSAGFGRLFVGIRGIFESEAVPGEGLLAALAGTGDSPWTYFYLRL